MAGEPVGLPNDELVCFVMLAGQFSVRQPAGGSRNSTTVQLVFDAATGNLLLWGVPDAQSWFQNDFAMVR
ncbi:hypothetical protein [Kutzneria buriramensis]|uniref:Uncharacterized protein n=2 Tax=Kutzneria buriramensis TaxID=1045776 RepID=A0A3E0HII7_9PSEU|nr:hypothetical protein BCF44_107437 [Kutzneria buriramensis]